jgi:glyoxylase I family protein
MSDMPPITSYHHLSLTVTDMARSEAWYRDVLGFVYVFTEQHPDGGGYARVLTRPGTSLWLGLHVHDANSGEEFGEHRTGLDHVGITVDNREDLDLWVGHLERHGVTFSKPVDGSIGDAVYAVLSFRDPDNTALELIWMPTG